MPEHVSFGSLAIVMAVAFVTPLALGLVPRLQIPAVVVEILAPPVAPEVTTPE